jgi:hypothetical protein
MFATGTGMHHTNVSVELSTRERIFISGCLKKGMTQGGGCQAEQKCMLMMPTSLPAVQVRSAGTALRSRSAAGNMLDAACFAAPLPAMFCTACHAGAQCRQSTAQPLSSRQNPTQQGAAAAPGHSLTL